MRYVLIDQLTELVLHERAAATKVFSGEEEFFRDHFPGFPIVPGALLTEAMSQVAGWLIAASLQFQRWPLLSMVQSAKFRRFVTPGEELRVEAILESTQTDACTVKASVLAGESRVASASLAFQLFPLSRLGSGQHSFEVWTQETFASIGGATLLEGPSA
jgi:3-hydroxyacyl-[acyl-carrier-protein] dehydratase